MHGKKKNTKAVAVSKTSAPAQSEPHKFKATEEPRTTREMIVLFFFQNYIVRIL